MKQWRKIRLWILMGPLLPFLYGTAVFSRDKPFAEQFARLRKWCNIILALTNTKPILMIHKPIPMKQGQLIVCNHQGSIDPFLLVSTLPFATTAVTKVENLKIPVLGTWLRLLKAVSFQRDSIRDSVRMLKDTAALLQSPRNVVIFPEGTRSKSNTLGEFKAGALKAAYLAQCDIVVVTLVNAHTILDEVHRERKPVYVVLDGVIPYASFADKSSQELADEIKQRMSDTIAQCIEEERK